MRQWEQRLRRCFLMLQLSAAGKRFGPRVLFEDANWLITPNERTALVGANGTGKSTLLKVLAGSESLDYGTLQRTRGMTIGYLPQEGLELKWTQRFCRVPFGLRRVARHGTGTRDPFHAAGRV